MMHTGIDGRAGPRHLRVTVERRREAVDALCACREGVDGVIGTMFLYEVLDGCEGLRCGDLQCPPPNGIVCYNPSGV
jgi:hypothetical protein